MNQKLKDLLNKNLTCMGKTISKIEIELFETFLESLNRVTVVYRHIGESYLKKQYRANTKNIPLLSEHLFLFGDKGKLFYETLDQKYYNIDIAEKDSKVFGFIYNKMKKVFVEKALKSSKSIDAIIAFSKSEPAFVSFWDNMTEGEWLDRINDLDEDKKLQIKDYYISLLHTVGLAGYGRNSYFLSTSRNATISEIMEFQKDGIEIVGWTKISKNGVINQGKIKRLSKVVDSLGFPVVSHAVFPEQEEITYKCGILPHFIIGYLYSNNYFEINPHVLKMQDYSSACRNGLDIDQSIFYQRLSEVGYKSTYMEFDDLFIQIPDITCQY